MFPYRVRSHFRYIKDRINSGLEPKDAIQYIFTPHVSDVLVVIVLTSFVCVCVSVCLSVSLSQITDNVQMSYNIYIYKSIFEVLLRSNCQSPLEQWEIPQLSGLFCCGEEVRPRLELAYILRIAYPLRMVQ